MILELVNLKNSVVSGTIYTICMLQRNTQYTFMQSPIKLSTVRFMIYAAYI